MRNFKRFATLVVAATMVTGSAFSSVAAEGGASGSGDYEGYVEETSVFTVEVPTDASSTAGFDFFVDPNNLLSQTNYASKGGNSAEFDTDSTLFFTRTVNATVTKKYGKDSDSITFTNKSSYDVDVEVSATVTGADGITLGAVGDATTDPTISLSLVSGSDTEAITADGAKLTGTIAGTDGNFEIKWNSTDSKYEYGLKDDADDDAWQTYSFNLTGACGGTWTAAQAEVQPTVNLTWKVTDPKATPADDYVMAADESGNITYTFAEKPEGSVTAVKVNGTDRKAAFDKGNMTYDSATGVFTVKSSVVSAMGLTNGGSVAITFGETSYTLTYTK